jgi:lipopolysaccharide biosynthesis regulator YciM
LKISKLCFFNSKIQKSAENRASNYFEKAYQADSENYRALYMLGMSFQRDGKQKKGEAYCNEAISKDPSFMKYKTPTN